MNYIAIARYLSGWWKWRPVLRQVMKRAASTSFFTPRHLWIQPLDMIGKPLFRIFYPSFLSSSLFKDFVKDKSNLWGSTSIFIFFQLVTTPVSVSLHWKSIASRCSCRRWALPPPFHNCYHHEWRREWGRGKEKFYSYKTPMINCLENIKQSTILQKLLQVLL